MKVSRLWFFLILGLTVVAGLLMPTSVQAAQPLVSAVAPNQGQQGETLAVTITGDNFTGANSVSFGPEIVTNSYSVDNATQISASITIDDDATVGARNVTVTVGVDTGNLTNGFTVNQAPPVVNSVTPALGTQGASLPVTIRGEHLDGATAVNFGSGINVDNFTVSSTSLDEVQVGTGTYLWSYPFDTYWMDARTQSILLASEVGQAGQIQKVRLYCSTRPSLDLDYLYIRMQHTDMTSFTGSYFVNSGWTTVLYAAGVDKDAWSVPGWVEFTLTTPFDYDGVRNLLVDYCMDNDSWTSNSGAFYATSASTYRTIYEYTDSYYGNLLSVSSGSRTTYYNNVVLVMDGTDAISANITINSAATAGSRDVLVTTPAGTDNLTGGFWVVAPPTITSLDPNQGLQGQSLSVTINGTGFIGATSVSFGTGINVTGFTVNSDTQIAASITINGSASAGARDVAVTNLAGTATSTGAFTVVQAPPVISSINPSWGLRGQTYSVTVWGSYFQDASVVSFGPGITVNSFSVVNSGRISASITIEVAAAAGTRDVSVTTPGGTATLTDSFVVVVPPVINSLDPDHGGRGQTLNVTITGDNFYYVSAASFGTGVTVNSIVVDNATSMRVNITISGTTTVGPRNVSITNPAGSGTKLSCFTVYSPPEIDTVTPTGAAQGQPLDVIITGNYFNGTSAVSFGPGVSVTDFSVDSVTQITASITVDASATPGARNVLVTTPGGTASETWGFRVFGPPTVNSVVPARGIRGDTLDVTITGVYLEGATSVDFGSDITVNSFSLTLPTEIRANITVGSSAELGFRDVAVTSPGGVAIKVDGFKVVALPAIASVNVTGAMPGESLEVTITGAHFGGALAVSFGSGVFIEGFELTSSSQIVAEISIGTTAVIGPRDVSVSTDIGIGTLTEGFAVTPLPDMTPDVDGVNPVAGLPGEEIEVVITGTNFTGATEVSFGEGITVHSFTVDSDTQITAIVDIGRRADVGARDVTVTTPEGTETFPAFFTVEAPPSSLPLYVWLLAGFGAAAVLGVVGIVVWRKKLAH